MLPNALQVASFKQKGTDQMLIAQQEGMEATMRASPTGEVYVRRARVRMETAGHNHQTHIRASM